LSEADTIRAELANKTQGPSHFPCAKPPRISGLSPSEAVIECPAQF
jgi:hypothetical protein